MRFNFVFLEKTNYKNEKARFVKNVPQCLHSVKLDILSCDICNNFTLTAQDTELISISHTKFKKKIIGCN